MVVTAQQKSELLRFKYLTDTAVYFIDETGADGRDCMRKFGYSLGETRYSSQHISAIAATSFDSGRLDCYTVVESVTGIEFVSYISRFGTLYHTFQWP